MIDMQMFCRGISECRTCGLEEEVEITPDIPRGTSFDCLSNKNLDSTSCVDAYGIGGGRAGAYGQRWGKGSLAREGGSPGTESAVTAALRWLHFHQDKNGQWDQDGFQKNCDTRKSAACDGQGTSQYDVANSSLALLAFLGNGHTHRVGLFKKTVKRGLDWLVGQQQGDGSLGPRLAESWIYNHAIGTMALCEAYAVTRDYRLKGPAQKAVDFIRTAQNPGLGWKYEPQNGRNDTSVTGWMVLALKAAKTAEAVPLLAGATAENVEKVAAIAKEKGLAEAKRPLTHEVYLGIMEKLDVDSVADLVRLAEKAGITPAN